MDVFSQGDAALALGWRMYKPFGLFPPPMIRLIVTILPTNSGDAPGVKCTGRESWTTDDR
jgi:hypothetical protein